MAERGATKGARSDGLLALVGNEWTMDGRVRGVGGLRQRLAGD